MPIQPGATLGVLGGGQLGRMFVHAAQRLGYRCVVLDPDPDSPAGQVAEHHLQADYGDTDALAHLSGLALAVTTEFENVPAQTLRDLSDRVRVVPDAAAVAICQDRALEKAQFARCRVACAPYAVVDSESSLETVPDSLLPGILKSARLGYDGKGQRSVRDRAGLTQAWRELGAVRCVLEQCLPLHCEISVVLARGSDGRCVHFAPFQNLHRGGILAVTQWPASDLTARLQVEAVDAAEKIARSMDYVGVLCVEFFVLADGTLCANEITPTPRSDAH
jgi:5-(carboxyamino)imidazole ribonucleotide synthase